MLTVIVEIIQDWAKWCLFFSQGSTSVFSGFKPSPPLSNFKSRVKHKHMYFMGTVILVYFPNLDVGTRLWPKKMNEIGQIASTGSLFPLLHDLSLSTANSGSSQRTPDCINILYRTYREGFRADVMCYTVQTPPCCLSRFHNLLNSSSLNYNVQ